MDGELTLQQRIDLKYILDLMISTEPDAICFGHTLTNSQRIQMYRASDIHDPRRICLQKTFAFLHENKRIRDHRLCPGDIADLLGAFY